MGKEHSPDDIRKKMLSYKVRVTTRISGTDKNKFMLDTLKKGVTESVLAKEIINIHYSLQDQFPELKTMEFVELKKYLIEKIKLK
jgi:hypothetical protein